jgi:hypothetical protein
MHIRTLYKYAYFVPIFCTNTKPMNIHTYEYGILLMKTLKNQTSKKRRIKIQLHIFVNLLMGKLSKYVVGFLLVIMIFQ